MASHIVAYDICHPKRLRKVARFWEARGLRVQKSVFLIEATAAQINVWFRELEGIIDIHEDQVCGWQITKQYCKKIQIGFHHLIEGETCIVGDEIFAF